MSHHDLEAFIINNSDLIQHESRIFSHTHTSVYHLINSRLTVMFHDHLSMWWLCKYHPIWKASFDTHTYQYSSPTWLWKQKKKKQQLCAKLLLCLGISALNYFDGSWTRVRRPSSQWVQGWNFTLEVRATMMMASLCDASFTVLLSLHDLRDLHVLHKLKTKCLSLHTN